MNFIRTFSVKDRFLSRPRCKRGRAGEISLTQYDEAILAQAVLSLTEDSVYTRTPEPLPEDSAEYRLENTQQTQPQSETQTVKQVKIYPNPFSNNFTVECALEKEALLIEIEVTDLVGRQIANYREYNKQTVKRTVETGNCNGMYICIIKADGKIIHQSKQVCLGN